MKKFIAITLSIVLAVAGLVFVPKAITTAGQTEFKILSPEDGSLKGAGHIDITWEDASKIKPVSDYCVYVDGTLMMVTDKTKYEFYTTKVNYHKAWVRVDFEDGTYQYTRTVRFGVTKKGLAMGPDMGACTMDASRFNAAWYYNWGRGVYPTYAYKDMEYVPMVWGDTDPDVITSKMQKAEDEGSKYMLGFNEPDMDWQVGGSNIPTETVIDLWPNFLGYNMKVGSPAYALWSSVTTSEFPKFMEGVDNNVDFVCIHCYPADWNGDINPQNKMSDWFLKNVVDDTYERYHKPIWITEYSTSGKGITQDGTSEFIKNVIKGLDERDYVVRQSFFSFDAATFGGGLWDYSTGELSKSGKMYAACGNPTTDYVTGSEKNPRDSEPTTKPGPKPTQPATKRPFNPVEQPLKIWSFYEGAASFRSSKDKYAQRFYNNVYLDDETLTEWGTPDDETLEMTQTAESIHDSFKADIMTTGWDGNYTGTGDLVGDNPYMLRANMNGLTVKKGHDYKVKFNVSWKNRKNAPEKNIQLRVLDESSNLITSKKIAVADKTTSVFELEFSNWYTDSVNIILDYGAFIYSNKQRLTTEVSSASGDLEITNFKFLDTGENPAHYPPEVTDPPTTVKPTQKPTTQKQTTKVKKPGKTKVKSAKKKKSSKKLKVTLKKVKKAKGYQIAVYKTKKRAKKNKKALYKKYVKKTKYTLKSKKLKKKKKLYVRARAYVYKAHKKKYFGKWSNVKKVKIKK